MKNLLKKFELLKLDETIMIHGGSRPTTEYNGECALVEIDTGLAKC